MVKIAANVDLTCYYAIEKMDISMTKRRAKEPAKKTAKKVAKPAPPGPRDDGEDVYLMEPMRISEECDKRAVLTDLVLDLTKKSASFRASLPKGLADPLADFVRSMNCYYSNLIENRHTLPINIERALNNDFSQNTEMRNLQLEAKAHIEVQRWIDEGGLDGNEMTVAGLKEIHRRFTNLLPDELRWVKAPETGEQKPVLAGEWRDHDVKVGRHVPVSPGAIPRFMRRFEARYSGLGTFESILAAGPAHHRFVYIHPFADGNGRVTRLMSYATLRRALDTAGLWSVARGLARSKEAYMAHLAECDEIRRGDRDGRGHLGEAALCAFTKFFLEVCLDQVTFMESLMQPAAFRDRIMKWAAEQVEYGTIPSKGPRVLEAILFKGSLPRGEVAEVLNQSERTANNVTQALVKHGIIAADGARAPWHIAFPARLAARLMPDLYPKGSVPEA
jgi:Fic family protein